MRAFLIIALALIAGSAVAASHKQGGPPENAGQQRSAEQHQINDARKEQHREEQAERKSVKSDTKAARKQDRTRTEEQAPAGQGRGDADDGDGASPKSGPQDRGTGGDGNKAAEGDATKAARKQPRTRTEMQDRATRGDGDEAADGEDADD